MNKSIISEQLRHDYPDYTIYLDAENRMVVADNHKMSLLNSSDALQTMNIFSRSGRSFYQAITQLLCSNYNIVPKAGSYADSLIIRQADLNKYKVHKLAEEWGIGFLETGKDILAVEVDDGIERDLLLESPMVENFDEENLPELTGSPEEEWAELEEIPFDKEFEYLEKGIEFVTAMEKLKRSDEEIKKEADNFELEEALPESKNTNTNTKKGIIKTFISNILSR